MDDKQIRISQMGVRMRDFGAEHTAAFPVTSVGGQKFAALNTLVAEVDQVGADQAFSFDAAQNLTGAKREGRKNVRRQMRMIRETAKAMEDEHPGISRSFRIPTTNGDEALINSARAFVEAATPLRDQFISREMPATFLEDLTAAINQFESDVSSYNVHRANSAAATASLKNSLSQIRKIRGDLDPIVSNKFRNDPAALAAWKSASHIERAPKKASTKAPAGQS